MPETGVSTNVFKINDEFEPGLQERPLRKIYPSWSAHEAVLENLPADFKPQNKTTLKSIWGCC